MPYRDIAARAAHELDPAVAVGVYCGSPGCNASTRAAIEFARADNRVTEMIGGDEYWVREGLPRRERCRALPRRVDDLATLE